MSESLSPRKRQRAPKGHLDGSAGCSLVDATYHQTDLGREGHQLRFAAARQCNVLLELFRAPDHSRRFPCRDARGLLAKVFRIAEQSEVDNPGLDGVRQQFPANVDAVADHYFYTGKIFRSRRVAPGGRLLRSCRDIGEQVPRVPSRRRLPGS